MHPRLRQIAHRLLPGLVKPYRAVRFTIIKLLQWPQELADVYTIYRKGFDFKSMWSLSLKEYYTGEMSPRSERCKPKMIVFQCDGRAPHGGITDRLKGILTTYREARRRGIPFYINWKYPFRLEDYLVPAGDVDWRIAEDQLEYRLDKAYPVYIAESNEPQRYINNLLKLKAALRDAPEQLHVYSNASNAVGQFPELYRELFRPSPALQSEIDRHKKILGARYWSFSFRFMQLLGDFKDYGDNILQPEEATALMEKVVAEFQRYLDRVPADCRVLVAGDSPRFLTRVADLDERIYIVPGGVRHVDFVNRNSHLETVDESQTKPADEVDTWMKAFVDQNLIMGAEHVYLLRTGGMYRSAFPMVAAQIGGRPFHDCPF